MPYLASGRLRPLYDGRSAAEIYATDVIGDPATLPLADAFVVDKDWHTQNPEAVDALLALVGEGPRVLEAAQDPNHCRLPASLLGADR